MSLVRYIVGTSPSVLLDAFGGSYRIVTHSQPELIVDARRTHNKSVLPKVEISGNDVRIGRQPLLRWFATRIGVDAKIVIPESAVLTVRLFSGNLTIAGLYRSIDVTLRNGTVTLDGPHFESKSGGSIRVVSGSLDCRKLSEAGYAMPLESGAVKNIAHDHNAPLRVQLQLGELSFS